MYFERLTALPHDFVGDCIMKEEDQMREEDQMLVVFKRDSSRHKKTKFVKNSLWT